jgi:hypothetical protein
MKTNQQIHIQKKTRTHTYRIIKIRIKSCFKTEAYSYAYMTQTTVLMTQHQNSSLIKVSRFQQRHAKISLSRSVNVAALKLHAHGTCSQYLGKGVYSVLAKRIYYKILRTTTISLANYELSHNFTNLHPLHQN